MKKLAFLFALTALAQQAPKESIIARAKTLELPTAYVPPPGDALEHHASGFAKVMCSNVFLAGLDPDFAAENTGYFTAPYEVRAKLGKPVVDRAQRTVSVKLPNGKVRVAKVFGSQGCITLPAGRTELYFKPSIVKSALPPADGQAWPMGDAQATDSSTGMDAAKLRAAVDAAFDPAGLTAAFLVVHKGKIVAERYGANITRTTPLESWSMGKSLSATLLAIQMQRGVYTLDQPAPIPEWQKPGDPRAKIRIKDILRMSSGLRIRAPQDPDYDASLGYPDHLYYYTGGVNAFHYAATRPQQWPPDTIGRYRNTDPVLTNYLTRLAVEKSGEDYLSYPQRALFDKIGIRTMVMETDPYGNFLTQGYEYASARDWARLGLLYMNGGKWNGEQIIPADFVKFVQTLAPAWTGDGRPIYGALFWINGDGRWPAPREAFFMAGAGGQYVLMIPSRQLMIVRLGHFKGSTPGEAALKKAIALVMSATER